jgi:hypothetical protein
MSIDPAYKNDSFGISTGYKFIDPATSEGTVIIDGVKKFEKMGDADATILPSDIKRFVVDTALNLNIYAFIYDIHMYPEILEAVEHDLGLEIIKHIVSKEDYDRWRELQEGLSKTKLRVVYDDNLEDECNSLFIKVMTGGKAKVDHPWNGCFVGETRIRALDGTCPQIKDLVNKELWVMSCKPNGTMVQGKARGRLTKEVSELIYLVFDSGDYVKCTPEHPFMLKNGEYKQAKDISGTDELMSCSSKNVQVTYKAHIMPDEPVPVYDLEVDKWDNFALMAGVYVHNSKDSADTVANCIWYLEDNDSVDYSTMTPIGCAATYDRGTGLSVFGSEDEDYFDFYC